MQAATPEYFLGELAHELRLCDVPALRSELRARVQDAWSPIAEDPSPGRWASAWQEQPATRAGPLS
jgi:hypothetical protein